MSCKVTEKYQLCQDIVAIAVAKIDKIAYTLLHMQRYATTTCCSKMKKRKDCKE
jgi:hypothetical protein